MLLGLDALDAYELLALVGDILRLLLVRHYVEILACRRRSVETEHIDRSGWSSLADLLPTLVVHGLDTAPVASTEHKVSDVDSSVLHEHSRRISAALVEG